MRIFRAALVGLGLAVLALCFSGDAIANLFPSEWIPAVVYSGVAIVTITALRIGWRRIRKEARDLRDLLRDIFSWKSPPQKIRIAAHSEPVVIQLRRIDPSRIPAYLKPFRVPAGYISSN